MVIAIDDHDSMALLRLFNEIAGKEYLIKEAGLTSEQVDTLGLMGISGISNMLCAIKFAKYYELTAHDVVATVFTDSVEMYQSRLEELWQEQGEYRRVNAAMDFAASIKGEGTDNMQELTYIDRKRIHNLKYFTWVEQQGRTVKELDDQWYHQEKTFLGLQQQADEIDALITEFNDRTGLSS